MKLHKTTAILAALATATLCSCTDTAQSGDTSTGVNADGSSIDGNVADDAGTTGTLPEGAKCQGFFYSCAAGLSCQLDISGHTSEMRCLPVEEVDAGPTDPCTKCTANQVCKDEVCVDKTTEKVCTPVLPLLCNKKDNNCFLDNTDGFGDAEIFFKDDSIECEVKLSDIKDEFHTFKATFKKGEAEKSRVCYTKKSGSKTCLVMAGKNDEHKFDEGRIYVLRIHFEDDGKTVAGHGYGAEYIPTKLD